MNWYQKSEGLIYAYGYNRLCRIAALGVGWVSLPVSASVAKKTIAFAKKIPDEMVMHKKEDGKEDYGLELHPHITIKYGIKTDDEEKIQSILDGQKGGTVHLGKIESFSHDDCDVLKIPVTGRSLHRLHKILTDALKIEDKWPEYNPHITLAYLKKDKAKPYLGSTEFRGLTFDFDEIVFEDAEDHKTTIKLKPEE